MANAGAITVFLADDNVIIREGVRAMLPHVDEFRPIHNLASMQELCRALSGEPSGRSNPRQWLRAS